VKNTAYFSQVPQIERKDISNESRVTIVLYESEKRTLFQSFLVAQIICEVDNRQYKI
jgi:hypothetical protein